MAPEQAVGRYADVRTDVYALGLVLYELLTGLLPVDASLAAGLAVTGAEAQIVPPRKLQSSIPRDLEAVVLKCLESSPADRYSSAAALAEDLRRFLHGKSTVARPAGILRKTWRAARRRPGLSLMSLLLLALGVTFIADDRWYAAKLSSTTSALHSSEYARDIRNAAAARRRGKAEQASALLAKYDDGQPGAASRGIEWYWLREALKPRAREINSQHGEAYCVLFSPDGQLLYSGGQDGVIRVWSTADGALLREMRGHGQAIAGGDCCVNQLGLGYDSNTLFSVSCDRTVRKWDARSGRLAGIVCRGETDLTCLAVARLHPWLALSNRGGAIQIWDFAANRILAEFLASEPKSRIDSIQFRPDDRKLVATAGVDMSVVIDTRSWSVEHRQKLGAESLCFVGREGMLALGSSLWVDSLMPWDTNSGTLGSRLGGLSTRIKSLAALDKHGVVFAGGAAGELHAMNLQRNVSRVMLASNSCVQGLATSADERQLASASFDGLLRIWNLQCDRQPLRLGGRHPVVSIALTSAADYAVALNSRAILTAWDITRNHMVGERADRHLAVCSQSGKFAIVKYPSVRKFGLVRLPSLRAVATVPEIDGLMSASISADDIHFATLDARGQVSVFDLRSATPIAEFNLPAQMDPASTQIALTPDATGLAWIRSGLLHHEAWDILQNRPMALPEDLSFLAAAVTYPPVMISPDGTRTLKSPDGSGDHLIVDIRTGADLALLRHPDRYRSDGAWTPDGRRIILPTHAGRHVIINADNGEALCELDTPLEPHFGPVQVSPDGETIQLISWTETPSQFYRTIWRAPRAASTGDRQ
jgi:WD40 repeat protein